MDPDPYSQLLFIDLQAIDPDMLIYGVSLLILFALSAFFSATETALFSLSGLEIDEFSQSESSAENAVARIMSKPQKLLATILIGNNFVNIAIVILSAMLISHFDFGDNQILYVLVNVVLVTFLLLLFGEVIPKVYATSNYTKVSRFVALPMSVLVTVLSIVSAPFLLLSHVLEKIFSRKNVSALSVDKLTQALEMTTSDMDEDQDKRILEGIVSFGKTEAKQVMTPRTNMFSVADEESFSVLKRQIVKQGYSRVPVYNENPDHIIGILYIKDLLAHLEKKDFEWQGLLRTPFFVPQNRKIDDILLDFQEKKIHMAIVVDEYGGTSGVLTLDDILEEIVGSISDEFDEQQSNLYRKVGEDTWEFEGTTPLIDFYRVLDLDEEQEKLFEHEKGEADTLAGLMLEISGSFPKKGERISFAGFEFQIKSLDRKRIRQILLRPEKSE